ncbi:MAG: MBL fold metallo-hydrolase [SAR202 cluster bacterium]|nr:MBL fold metallo-hydrolase [SAR202 cluster bacterium]
MQISPHVYQCHIPDTHAMHPGGTNIYFVGDPAEEMVVIDTGDYDRDWTRQILEFYEKLGKPKITRIVVTHGHMDHIGGLDRVQDAMQAPVGCHPKLAKKLSMMVGEKNVVKLRSREMLQTGGGTKIRALFTPGHAEDHVCFYVAAERVLFTGDTILGASSSTVEKLDDYMKSLGQLSKLRAEIIAPAHGPVVPPPRGRNLSSAYMGHRNGREEQVLAALAKGITSPDEMVKDIYPKNLKKALRPAATRNVRQHLEKLKNEKRVVEIPASYKLSD